MLGVDGTGSPRRQAVTQEAAKVGGERVTEDQSYLPMLSGWDGPLLRGLIYEDRAGIALKIDGRIGKATDGT